MIVIQTYYSDRKTCQPFYKDYHATCGLKAEMSIINDAKDNHDLNKYTPIMIYNIYDTEEE